MSNPLLQRRNSSFQKRHQHELDLLGADWTSFEEISEVVGLSKDEQKYLSALCGQEDPSPTALARQEGLNEENIYMPIRRGLKKVRALASLLDGFKGSLDDIR